MHDSISEWPTRSGAAKVLDCSEGLVTLLLNRGALKYIPTKAGKLIDPEDLRRLKRERAAKAK